MWTSSRKIVATILLVGTVGMSRTVTAAPDKQLVVSSASLNRSSETLILKGLNFGAGTPVVMCESMPLTVLSATDTQLVVLFPSAIADGTYLVTVLRGSGQPERGLFYVTAQSVATVQGSDSSRYIPGPLGEPGPVGPAGPAGSWFNAKSIARNDRFATFPELTAFALSWTVPTLFAGSRVAATPTPPSATSSAVHATTMLGDS